MLKSMTQKPHQVVNSALTAMQAQPTKAEPVNTAAWAEWLEIETLNDPQLEAMAAACGRFILRFKARQSPAWLSLLGDSGVGKTHCADRVWRWLAARFNWADCEFIHRKIYWASLIRDLRGGKRYDELRELSEWPVLFLDDIGAERDTTGFAAEQLNTLLGTRVGKWTILTSNLMLEQLAGIDVRIADRIIREPGNEFIEVKTESYAVRQPHKNE